MSIERRRKERVELILIDQEIGGRLPVWLVGNRQASVLALLVDLSETGGRFLLSKDSPLPRLGLTIKLLLDNVAKSEQIEFRAEKLWSRTDMSPIHNVIGCRFIIPDPALKEKLAKLVSDSAANPEKPQYLGCELYYDEVQKLYKDTEYL